MGPLNQASKYMEELDSIMWDVQLSKGRSKRGPLFSPISQYSYLPVGTPSFLSIFISTPLSSNVNVLAFLLRSDLALLDIFGKGYFPQDL